jgi:hypothetical protein
MKDKKIKSVIMSQHIEVACFLNSLIRTSGHLIIEGGEASNNPQDCILISMENLIFNFSK